MNDELRKAKLALQTARGQIDAVINMIEEGRYCVDISNQVLAAQSLLKRANLLVLEQHLNHCVKDAFINHTDQEKTKEVMEVISRMIGK